MLNKDKRSLLLCLVLGDGCLHYVRNGDKLYGGITIDHGIKQADYQAWKAQLLSFVFSKSVKVRTGHKGNSVQVSVTMKRLRAWRKFTYPNNKKSIPRILRFIRHPELAISILLMDDGYVERSASEKKLYSACFRIYLCDQTPEELKEFSVWIKANFDVETKVAYQKTRGKSYPFLKLTQTDSLKLWQKIRDFVLQFKSMRYKFRYIESIYQHKFLQRVPG